jgi:hypothetical protein
VACRGDDLLEIANQEELLMATKELAPKIVIPRGRSAEEKRLGAIAALHQPVPDRYGIYRAVCGECGDRDLFRANKE